MPATSNDNLTARRATPKSSLRKRVHEILEVRASGDGWARVAGLALVGMIIANVAAIILQSMPALDAAYHPWFGMFEAFSIGVFTAEYSLRVWSSVEDGWHKQRGTLATRLRYVLSPMALIDLIAILPFYLSFLAPVDLRFMRVFRLFLVLKLTRYQASMTLLGAVLRNEAKPIAAALFILAILLIVVSTFAYLVEGHAQPDAFGSIPDAMYWAIMTMTTVGYGDVTPITAVGRVLATLIMLLGVGIVALPAAMLAARFAEELQGRRDELAAKLDVAMGDGQLDQLEFGEIAELSRELGVPRETLDRMLHARSVRRLLVPTCPHCGKSID